MDPLEKVYQEMISRDVHRRMVPIKHKRWHKLSFNLSSFQPGSYHLSSGIYGKEYMTSLDSAYNFTLGDDKKAIELMNYICDEVQTVNFEKLSVRGIVVAINKIAEPIIKRFQQPDDTEGIEPDSGLADRFDALQISDEVKEVILVNLPELEEYLPKGLINQSDEALTDYAMFMYMNLTAKHTDPSDMITNLNNYHFWTDEDGELNK